MGSIKINELLFPFLHLTDGGFLPILLSLLLSGLCKIRQQVFTAYNTGKIYTRVRVNNSWTSWIIAGCSKYLSVNSILG